MIANTPEAWTERALTAAASHEAALWSPRGQRDRFAAVLGALKPQPGETLLDYGCGTGSLSEVLPHGVGYTGVDWSAGMITRARREHPGRAFCCARAGEVRLPADVTACVGPFNLRENWSKKQTWETIATLWSGTRRALATSFYAGSDTDCLIYDEDELTLLATRLLGVRWFSIRRHRRNDLLLVMTRQP